MSNRELSRAELKELIELLELAFFEDEGTDQKMNRRHQKNEMSVVPLFGRDEMNLVEFPFGPITGSTRKTFESVHPVFDKQLKREVLRKLLITGSDAFGLPKPIDDQVLVGMKALTYESGFQSRKVNFSRYQLCKTIGWSTDGKSYRRLEESFDRIAGVTLKFKDAWWDKGEMEWKSKTFHLIEEVELCSKDRFDAKRQKTKSASYQLCSFVWNETIWKSFSDGYVKKLDMEMFRRVRSGRRKEIPLRLLRILDKRFYNSPVAKFDLEKLCKGTLGLNEKYCPSEMIRILKRAADWLIECGFMASYLVRPKRQGGELEVVFYKKGQKQAGVIKRGKRNASPLLDSFDQLEKEKQEKVLAEAISRCQDSIPHIVKGYLRSKGSGKDTEREYLIMILEEFDSLGSLVA